MMYEIVSIQIQVRLIESDQNDTDAISSCFHHQTSKYHNIVNDNGKKSSNMLKTCLLKKSCDIIQFLYFIDAFNHSRKYRELVESTLDRNLNELMWQRSCHQDHLNQNGVNIPVGLIIRFSAKHCGTVIIDKRWCSQILKLALIRMEIEESLSWLSTLGGAFSSLGDRNVEFARKAGRVSISQLKLSCICGDPNLVARCLIYISHSLCQQGQRKKAIQFVRYVLYPCLVQINGECERIIKEMYKALCFRIRFIYK